MSKLTQGLFSTLALSALALSASAQTFTTTTIASGFSGPVFLTSPPGDMNRMFVVEQSGRIEIIKGGAVLPTAFLTVTPITLGSESGVLGLAFHPDFANNGEFFVSYSASGSNASRIGRYTVSGDPMTNDVANPAGDVIFTTSQPFSNHNGGCINFGPDGMLYFALGDGGSGNDPGDRAQNPALLLGKMLRIDVDGDDFPGDSLRDYAIPAGNPSFGAGSAPELWQIGLRNPWRFSFDFETDDMWIGDVGQNAREEINLVEGNTGGQNFGWKCREGNICGASSSNFCTCGSAGFTEPVFTYVWTGGNSAIGGYAYRGPLSCIQGIYFFADLNGRVWTAEKNGMGGVTVVNRTSELAIPGGETITSFGQDAAGNLYIVDVNGNQIHRIELDAPGCPVEGIVSCNGDGGDQMGCTDCPCSNNATPGTVGGCLNSVADSALLTSSGVPAVLADTLRFELEGLAPFQFSILNSGNEVAPNNPVNVCFGLNSGIPAMQFDGLRCAVNSTTRHGGRGADANGEVGMSNAGWGIGDGPMGGIIANGGFVAGQTRAFQAIYRDSAMVNCMTGLNTSQAISYTMTP